MNHNLRLNLGKLESKVTRAEDINKIKFLKKPESTRTYRIKSLSSNQIGGNSIQINNEVIKEN